MTPHVTGEKLAFAFCVYVCPTFVAIFTRKSAVVLLVHDKDMPSTVFFTVSKKSKRTSISSEKCTFVVIFTKRIGVFASAVALPAREVEFL